MRIRDREQDDISEINLIPLIDVILCLIIFFVVTTTFDSRAVLRLQLPRAEGETTPASGKPLTILVNADGRYFIEDRESLRNDLSSLKATIAEVAGSSRERPVLLRADARTQHQAVVTAYEALGQLGFKQIMIATAPQQKGAATK